MGSSRLDVNFTQEKPKRFPWLPATLLLILGIVIFRVASGGKGFDFERFTATLNSLDPVYAFLAVIFIVLSYLGRAIRWEVMMRPLSAPLPLTRLAIATTIGFTAVVVLGRAGEFVRPWLIARESRTSFAAQMAIWLFERIYDLLIVIIFFGYGLIHLASSGRVSGVGPELAWVISSGGWAALAGALVCLSFIFALRFLSPDQRQGLTRLLDFLPHRLAHRLRPMADSFLEGAAASCDARLQWRVMLYTLLEWIIIAICQWSVFRCFPVTGNFSVSDVVAIVGLVSFGAVVQLPGIGGGMQVAAIAVLTQIFAVPLEEATSVALVLWIASFMLVVPVGLWLAFREGLKLNQLGSLK